MWRLKNVFSCTFLNSYDRPISFNFPTKAATALIYLEPETFFRVLKTTLTATYNIETRAQTERIMYAIDISILGRQYLSTRESRKGSKCTNYYSTTQLVY